MTGWDATTDTSSIDWVGTPTATTRYIHVTSPSVSTAEWLPDDFDDTPEGRRLAHCRCCDQAAHPAVQQVHRAQARNARPTKPIRVRRSQG